MAIDKEVEQAILETVQKLEQPERVAKRLIAWLKDLSERELTPDEQQQHLDSVKAAIQLGEEQK